MRSGRTVPPPQSRIPGPPARGDGSRPRAGCPAPYLRPPLPGPRAGGRRAIGCGRGATTLPGPWRGPDREKRGADAEGMQLELENGGGRSSWRAARAVRGGAGAVLARPRRGTLCRCALPPPTARCATPAHVSLAARPPPPPAAPCSRVPLHRRVLPPRVSPHGRAPCPPGVHDRPSQFASPLGVPELPSCALAPPCTATLQPKSTPGCILPLHYPSPHPLHLHFSLPPSPSMSDTAH